MDVLPGRWFRGTLTVMCTARQIHASLLAGAMGDSLGANIEFLHGPGIAARLPGPGRALPTHKGVAGAITDDTQMTLFTAEGLIEATGEADLVASVHRALLRWLETQDQESATGAEDRPDHPGLLLDPRLHVRRAPGITCLSALERIEGPGAPVRNDSKGCGTIMRVAPVAFAVPRDRVAEIAVQTSALTHGHPTGLLAAAAWAELLADVAGGADPEAAAAALARRYRDLPDGGETAQAIDRALSAPRDGRQETVESLGGAWVAEEALSIALYAALASGELEQGLRIAVAHSGDSDSAGAVAGNLLGLMHTEEVFDHPWAGQVECADLIREMAEGLSRSAAARGP